MMHRVCGKKVVEAHGIDAEKNAVTEGLHVAVTRLRYDKGLRRDFCRKEQRI